MVLFVYITRLASNEKFKINLKEMVNIINPGFILIIIILIIFFSKNYSIINITVTNRNIILFRKSITVITIIVITYLFLTLIVVVKVASKIEGPLRSFIE